MDVGLDKRGRLEAVRDADDAQQHRYFRNRGHEGLFWNIMVVMEVMAKVVVKRLLIVQ